MPVARAFQPEICPAGALCRRFISREDAKKNAKELRERLREALRGTVHKRSSPLKCSSGFPARAPRCVISDTDCNQAAGG